MQVTLNMVAEACGVSRGTVDRVLHNRGRVSEETRKLVQEKIEELGYKHNTLGQALASRKKQRKIGIILCSIDNVFFDEMIRGIQDALRDSSAYAIEAVLRQMKGYDVAEQLRLMEELQGEVDCLILNAVDDLRIAAKIDEYMEKGIGVFTVNTDISFSKRIAFIGVNVIECGEIACGLIGLLCNKKANVLIVTGSLSVLEHRDRIRGFRKMAEERYPQIKLAGILESQDEDMIVYQKMVEFLKSNPDIQAMFVGSLESAGVLRALEEAGREDVHIVCCDMTPDVQRQVQLGRIEAVIDQQPWSQGYEAVNQVIQYLISGEYGNIPLIKNQIRIYENRMG
ncbi:MAG: substrate-binding domain-containing protein [Lachnospiraceae bacterium]|jgi:LacI family transcriptional regulator|nr:substrate-binding domain-containing protein [Lachnospiraceae bacterium]MCI8995764.1 substrate-binding domain-containing protein [Lachnospiraceae bacterium]MCI9134709.1 substrate-binding domain-containing protein [Lachnospiraceae bacterium]